MFRPGKVIILSVALAISSSAFGYDGGKYKPGEVIVKFKEGVLRTRSEMNRIYDVVGVQKVRRHSVGGIEHLILNDSVKVEDAVADLEREDSVEYAQPNYLLHTFPTEAALNPEKGAQTKRSAANRDDDKASRPDLKDAPADVIPPKSDPDLGKTYGLSKIHAQEAWIKHSGSKKIVVADIDTGIDYNHEDLAFNVWRNPHPSDKKDVVGFDFVHNDGLPFDDNQHGTHTAGTIGAVGGNGVAISGVSPRVSLMSLKFLSAAGSGSTSDAVRAIDYAVEHKANLISASWGGPSGTNKALKDSINRAREKGVLFVAAAGNSAADNDGSNASYPAAFKLDNMLAVAATDQDDKLASFSNYGKETTHVGAPGVKVYSTVPGNKYASLSGTSMACPHVAGAAALLWAAHPRWDYKKIKEVLMKTSDPLPSLKDKTASGGRINILSALNSRD